MRCPDADTEAAHAAEVSDRGRPKDPNPTLRTLSVGVQNIVVQHALSQSHGIDTRKTVGTSPAPGHRISKIKGLHRPGLAGRGEGSEP